MVATVEQAREQVRPDEAVEPLTAVTQQWRQPRFAELAVLGRAIAYPACLSEALTRLSVDDLFDPCARSIWEAIAKLAASGAPLEFSSLAHQLAGHEDWRSLLCWLVDAMAACEGPANLAYYLEVILARSRLRHLEQVGQALSQAAKDSDDPAEVATEAERMMREVQLDGPARPTGIGQLVKEAWREIERLSGGGAPPPRVPTGLGALDGRIGGGLAPGQLWILAARPAMGKTALALAMIEAAARARYRSLLFSLEMPKEEITHRLVSMGCGLPVQALRNGIVPTQKWPLLASRFADLSSLPLEVYDPSRIELGELRAKAQQASLAAPVGLIVVDYLQLVGGYKGRKYGNREQEVADISRELKALSKELHCPVLALAQLNRDIERRPLSDRIPRASDLRDSGQLEQDADGILTLHRPIVVDEEADPKEAILAIVKQRSGPTCRVTLAFDGPSTRFTDPGVLHG